MLNAVRGSRHSSSVILVVGRLLLSISFSFSLTSCKNIFSGGGADGQSDANIGFAPGLDPLPLSFSIIDLMPLPGFTSVNLSWQNSEFAQSYTVMYRQVGQSNFTRIPNSTSPGTVTGLEKNKRYEFQVEASNERGVALTGSRVVSLVNAGVRTGNFVASSNQLKRTASGKVFQGSIAELGSQIQGTTPNGYKVYSNIQGQLLLGTGGSQ